MIVFELQCSERHRFEGWFASPEAFERQLSAGEIACPVCTDPAVRKVPSARIRRPKASPPALAKAAPAGTKRLPAAASGANQQMTLAAFIDHVLVNSEDVGTRFADEARRIHKGDAPHRSIRGQSSAEETEALLEEGVPVFPLPIPPKDSWQ
ncbi:MAG: DUF1178 family protein [Gammaproteobacteria bacterium]|nr:DUF1178 family protein [Gammaproteobacteria bacterium]